MSRAERLLELMQVLRRHRHPVSGSALATELGISLRTLYRDIASLQAQGAQIDGEPGVGYVLRPGFLLPPLMFTDEEIEALVLGSSWVAGRTDSQLAAAAGNALAKICAVLPADLRHEVDASTLSIGPGIWAGGDDRQLAAIRRAIRREHKLDIRYSDQHHRESRRLIWPLALGYLDRDRVVIAWCELRGGIRHFRADRILSLTETAQRFPERRQRLLRTWRDANGTPVR